MKQERSRTTRTVHSSKLVWIASAFALLFAGMAMTWWWRTSSTRSQSDEETADVAAGPAAVRAKARRRDPVAYVSRLAEKQDAASVNELIQLFVAWAPHADTLEARKLAIQALLKQPNLNIALESILTAVDGDQTRREQDPLWRDLVKGVAGLWNAATFPLGRNRMYIEEREKPRALLLESLTEIRPEQLSDEQRTQVAADFIDLYPGAQADQKSAINRALTTLGNGDVVEILAGRGLGEGSHLKVVAERNRAIESARAIPLPPVVQETDEPPPAASKPTAPAAPATTPDPAANQLR